MNDVLPDMSREAAWLLVSGSACVLIGCVVLIVLVVAANSSRQERRDKAQPNRGHNAKPAAPTAVYGPTEWDEVFRREELRRDGYSGVRRLR